MSRNIAGLLIFLFMSGCSPWYFDLQQQSGWPIEGKIIADRHRVEVVSDNVLRIEHPAAVSMRTEQITDGMFDTEIIWLSAGDLELRFRSTPYDDSVHHHEALVVHLTVGETTVTYDGKTITQLTPMPVDGTPFRLRVIQHGNLTDVVVNCSQVARIPSLRPSSQWVSIRPLDDTSVELRDPKFLPLADEFSRVSYP